MVTMKDIADTVGVSRTTVSAVLNNKQDKFNISDKTSQLIEETAKKMNYYRNSFAVSMVTGKSKEIAYFAFDLHLTHYIGRTICSTIMEAANHGYSVKLSGYTKEKFKENVRIMLEQRPAGIIAHLYPDAEYYTYLSAEAKKMSIPVIFLGGPTYSKNGLFVHTDDVSGVSKAVEYLHCAGHRRIGYLGFSGENQLRYRGYKEGLKNSNLKLNEEFIFSPDEYDRYFTMSPELRPTAFCAGTDKFATNFFRQAYKAGLRVPDDVSLIGFGDISASDCIVPLTTLHQSFEQIGQELTTLLCEEINSPEKRSFNEVIEKLVKVELIERESVAPPIKV